MSEVSEETQVDTGVKASESKNDWEAMARQAQSKADKYESIKSKYGENFEDKLDGFSEFEKQWLDNPKTTIERLSEQAGIKINEPQPQNMTQEELDIWELGKEGSKANSWLENRITSKSEKIAQKAATEAVAKYKQEQQVNEWRTQLKNNGITDIKKQNEAIREFLNPNPDFNQFLQSKVSQGQSQGNQDIRPSDVMQQVAHNQKQPQSTGVLQGGMPPQKTWEEQKTEDVMNIVKQKRGTEGF